MRNDISDDTLDAVHVGADGQARTHEAEFDAQVDAQIDAETDAMRAGTWALLGRLLADAPDEEMLARLAQADSDGGRGDALALAWLRLAEAARTAQAEALQREYQDVFVGVGGGEVTPYASWYLTGTLLDRPLVQLRDDLQALGIARAEHCSEPEDHAAAVCEIMAFVLQDEDVDFDWQRELFQRHVAGWMGRLFDDVAAAPSATFYRAVAALGRAFVDVEQRFYEMSA